MDIRNFLLLILMLLVTGGLCTLPVAAATSQLHIVKYANDGTTILNETTKTVDWLEANLPVQGDGTTHYYHQGPVFLDDATNETHEQELRWNAAEDTAVQEKDMGAVKGTSLKDLCDLVGGMNSGEYLYVKASDGFKKKFAYANVYEYPARQGPMVITWYKDGQYVSGSYSDGMKLVFFADTSGNPWGIHAFGNNDWHESAASEYWYYYSSGSEQYPTTTGLSVKYVSDILIYSDDSPPPAGVAPVASFTATPLQGTAPLDVRFTDSSTGTPTSWNWDFTNDGTTDSTVQSPSYTYSTAGTYSVRLKAINAFGNDEEIRDAYITVSAAPTLDTMYDGTVTLTTGETFIKHAYNNATGGDYTISRTTPLGALDKVAAEKGLAYNVTDKRWPYDQALLLDDIGSHLNKKPNVWSTYVNGVLKDGYGNHANGVNVVELADNDQVNFYYAPNKDPNPALNATAVIKVKVAVKAPDPGADTLYDGTITLKTGETFVKHAYNNATGGDYTISRTTPLGALDKVAADKGLAYNVTDKRWPYDQALLLDDIGSHLNKKPNVWSTYVNGVLKDGYGNHANGVNVVELADNDQVNFYYAPSKDPNPAVNATAIIKVKVSITTPDPGVDTIYDGTVTLTTGETFVKHAYNNATGGDYTISRTTPLGALDKVAADKGLAYNVTDKRWPYDQALLLDDIGSHLNKKPNVWSTYVNGVLKDGYGNHANGVNVVELSNNDQVNFYYAPNKDPNPALNATAVIKVKVSIGSSPPSTDWTLALKGAKTTSVTRTYFEQGLACTASGHQVFWTDTDGNIWGGVPLWLLVSMIDDSPDTGSDHFNFNDSLAAKGYSVKVSSGDGWDTTLASGDIARNNSYLVANTLNGQALPRNLTSGKLSWPLQLKGAAVFGGQQVGNITAIELTGMPEPETGWTLTLEGDVTDIMTQAYFEEAIASHHNLTWTDGDGHVWEGMSLWDLAGAVDDIETSHHYTFNDTRSARGYTIRVSAADGYNTTFASADVAHNDGFIVAHKMDGVALTGTSAPLKLVGPSTTSNKQRIGAIKKISLEGLPDQFPAGNWQVTLNGKISDVIPQGEFEYWAQHHSATYTDTNGNVYTGIPLWRVLGWVDDRIPHGQNGFNDAAATAGYTVVVKAGDGYAKEFTSTQIGKDTSFIVANTMNGAALAATGDHPPYPLRLVGSGATGGNSVGNIVEIQLTDFQTPVEAPRLHIVKYGIDGKTVINETTIDYHYMEDNLPVIGDGVTHYKYQGVTFDPNDLWDQNETKGMNPPKVDNAIKGTRIKDLVELVGGMGTGTDIVFVASDGYETTMGYSNIYTNPYVQSHQGDAVLAWYADGQYVPQYGDGMRFMFTPEDHVFGQWDMHEAMDEKYWHYYWSDNVKYPSAAGSSAKYITEIRVYSSVESDWQIEVDGREIGGMKSAISKTYLEQALACQFGSNHKATYTDSKGRVWEGMPLWFFAGFVDDADQHSNNAFNTSLAQSGYSIVITGLDDYTTILSSQDIIRTGNYLVANSLNGTHLKDTEDSWPLRLTGANVTGDMTVKGVTSIRLVKTITKPVAAFTADATSGTAPLRVRFTDQSAGTAPLTYAWDFDNDGTIDNTTANPSYTFATAGNYTVNLTVTNTYGSNSEKRIDYITVRAAEPGADKGSIQLYQGWNFISTPKRLAAGANNGTIFSTVDTASHSVFTYDASTGLWHQIAASDEVKPLDGVWIYSSGSSAVPLTFDTSQPQVPPKKKLYAGWNAISLGYTEPATARDTLLDIGWTRLIGWNAATNTYEVPIVNGGSAPYSDSRQLAPTAAYWVYVKGTGNELGAFGA